MSRAYCRQDKPFPVSAACRKTLSRMAEAAGTMNTIHAPAQLQRLRRGGYVRIDGDVATITAAGNALLAAKDGGA